MSGFKHTLRQVALAHVVIVAGFCVVTWWRARVRRPDRIAVPVTFVMEAAAAPAPLPPTPTPAPTPAPAPEPVPEPAPTVSEPRQAPKPRVKPDARWIRREPQAAPLSREEIERMLMPEASAQPRTVAPDEIERGLALVRAALYRAWTQPTREAAGDSVVEAVITLSKGGQVVGRRLKRPSGNPAMDASVLAALKQVAKIPGLSERFLAARKEVTIAFRLE